MKSIGKNVQISRKAQLGNVCFARARMIYQRLEFPYWASLNWLSWPCSHKMHLLPAYLGPLICGYWTYLEFGYSEETCFEIL